MPAMPRPNSKIMRIVFKLLGRSLKEPKASERQQRVKLLIDKR